MEVGKDKTGIGMNVVDGKPQFVHRTLAEYFTARWFSRNFKNNRSVLEHILLDRKYRVMINMFDRMLTKDCPLHYALIEENKKTVNTLLAEGCNLNVVDKGGRTVMHIIAIRDSECWDEINNNSNNTDSLHNTDSVLQWTPLQYAIQLENWSTVERLLESNVDRCGLDMIRQRAQDPHYINSLILHAAENGHVLLLEFLCGIGVNIHQASSTDFPSPLHAAIEGKQPKVVKWLIQHGADCNTRYSDGQTPLFYAVTKGSLDVVRALVEEGGASLVAYDKKGNVR
jgi:ankyrin repeat protein